MVVSSVGSKCMMALRGADGIESRDIWEEVSRFFVKENKNQHMNLKKVLRRR